ncbi:hypothetical protein ACPPVV_00290 [Rhodanobacter sp. Col0626]|uniref:hypothetical protein n=1 Tax=Rhodanobacter sp. Col0626 TaxID=3415679 RepID=UPI003CE9EB13
MAATYNGLDFHTPLLAQWAAFFDLAHWQWSRGISPIGDWQPDFRVSFECGHSGCSGGHTILISVLAVTDIASVKGHPALSHFYGVTGPSGTSIADAGAVFGANPQATQWQMSHGSGGGIEEATNWAEDAYGLWQRAKAMVQVFTAET